MNLTSLDIRYAVRELQQFVDGKIEKVMQSDEEKRDILLTIYKKDLPKAHLRFVLPGLVCLHEVKPQYQKIPPGFAMFLRKYIGKARIKTVEQLGFDRIIVLSLSTKYGDARLIVEMIPPGNMILELDGRIKGLMETQNYGGRTLRGGIGYVPPEPSFNTPEATNEELKRALDESDRKTLVTRLAMTLHLGGKYAEEVCLRAGVDKRNGRNEDVLATIQQICSDEDFVCRDETRPYPIRVHGAQKSTGTFLHALESCVPVRTPRVERGERLEKMRKAQDRNIELQEEIAVQSRRAGERIYEEYQTVQGILRTAKQARRDGTDIGEALKKHPQVRRYLRKTQEIEVDL